ncbi:MAG TPA: response regulator [Cyanothece sp. UBA12306]|nr:response regulator [Cyanothece sp. UBA12306]
MQNQWSHTIIEGSQSGCFQITNPQDPSIVWYLYFNGRNIEYITSKIGQRERLGYLLTSWFSELSFPYLGTKQDEYQNLSSWWQSQQLSQAKLHQLLFQLSQEALVQILSIDDPLVEFYQQDKIDSPVTTYPWDNLFESAKKISKKWQAMKLVANNINTFSRLHLDPDKNYKFYKFWKIYQKLWRFNAQKISFWLLNLSRKKCLYELAKERKVNPLIIAYQFRELFKQEVITIFPFEELPQSLSNTTEDSVVNLTQKSTKQVSYAPKPIIACIDDSQTVQVQIKHILQSIGYEVLSITDPTSSLTILVRHQPVLILMDIKMPEIDGHQLSQMLQKSRTLKDIPIVMLTAEEGMVSRLQSKLSGASYYLKKPCNIDELVKVVERFTSNQSST